MSIAQYLLAAAIVGLPGALRACPAAVPAGLGSEPVGETLVVNGLPMTIRQVTAKEAPAAVLDRVEQAWKDERFQVRRERAGEWDIVAAGSADCLATLQLIARDGSFGYFGVSQPAREQPWLPKRLSVKLPGGIELNSSVSSVDSGRRGTTVSFSTKRSIGDIDSYFLRHLNDSGWQAVSSHELRGQGGKNARVVSGQKGRELVSIVLWHDGMTRAMLNLSETP
jgi:hypothetical protein